MSRKHHVGSPVHDQPGKAPHQFAHAAPAFELLEPRLLLSVGALPGDANLDGQVDVLDLAVMVNNFGSSGATWAQCDFNGDTEVDILDLAIMANHFGEHLPYQLTITDGSGSGYYNADDMVAITADTPPAGKIFNMWIANVGTTDGHTYLDWDDQKLSSTTYRMADHDAEVIATYRDSSAPLDWYPRWEYICNQQFGAEEEPLAYEFFGSDLVFQSDGKYEYASETSALVAWETNLPATTYIEYGTTTGYDSRIDQDDRFTYLHQYHVTGLSNNTTYHYRIVATDERGNIITSPDDTFATATPSGTLIRLAGGSRSTAYTLGTEDATYLLEGDLIADGVAFKVTANNVKLDLGGHTVIYNQVDEPFDGDWEWDRNISPVGVRAIYRSGIKVRNGTIRQGLGYNQSSANATGFSPIFFYSSTGELAGLHLEWAGPQVAGIALNYSAGTVIHHNTLLDHGGDITNRHQGTRAIGGASTIHHNLILRARHRGIDGTSNANYYDNEIYIDSVCTNAFAILLYGASGSNVHGNRIFGGGYHMIGIGMVANCANDQAYDNYLHLRSGEPDHRFDEYGYQSGVNGFRQTWGGVNLSFHDNVVSCYASDGGAARGLWVVPNLGVSASSGLVFSDNILKAIFLNTDSTLYGPIAYNGDGNVGVDPAIFQRNRIVSNLCNVYLSSGYGYGNNSRFYDNTIVKAGPSRGDYRTINIGYGGGSAVGHYFYDTTFEGGASFDSYNFSGYGTRNFYVGWTLTVQTQAYATVTIRDAFNSVVFSGTADGSGEVSVRLLQYKQLPTSRTYYTDHEVTVEKSGFTTEIVDVTMDATKTVLIPLT